MALFYRANAQSRALEDGLRTRRIPYRIVRGRSFYDRAKVKDVAATGYRFRHLGGGAPLDRLEVFHLVFPRAKGMSAMVSHPGQEQCYVLSGAVLFHVDGSGRLQTVTWSGNPRYARLIEAFRGISGVPIVLNTSFHENEPVVCKPEEAIDYSQFASYVGGQTEEQQPYQLKAAALVKELIP